MARVSQSRELHQDIWVLQYMLVYFALLNFGVTKLSQY